MFTELMKAVDYLNEGKVIEAGRYLLELGKGEEDEDLLKVMSEIEKEIREIENEKTYMSLETRFKDEVIHSLDQCLRCRQEKIRVLSIYLLERLSNGNEILLSMIRLKGEAKPNTFI
ncbi:hypothetical protein [Acidianus sp. RZ1]|uniref:hypothetical protein n=1 Tax=Acidianus sp. RZ1 TaxID=1540082 RepID=UPI001490A33A|nr:hypothetical protein [Acidianus sp. RZ1]NON63268.1 hypothetical protein [Acidianus sp. RZ1]